MSLTSMLDREPGRKNLKDWFKHHFPTTALPAAPRLVVEPTLEVAYSAEIGTAFDYLFRFKLEQQYSGRCTGRNWIARAGLKKLVRAIETTKESWIIVGNAKPRVVDKNQLRTVVLENFAKAEKHYEEFKQSGFLSESLVKSCVFLARLDSMFRAGIIAEDFEQVQGEEIMELIALLHAVPWSEFAVMRHCELNPIFGASSLVGGADADLRLDNRLLDLKTTRFFKLERKELNQLLGYYLLAVLSKQAEEITELGIYFARFGFLWTLPLTTFYDMPTYSLLAEQFARLVANPGLELVSGDTLRQKQNLRQINWDFL